MDLWKTWKQGFDAWESATATYLEQWMKSPLVLEPSGALLTASMKTKKAVDDAVAAGWARAGLPTRRDQERMLYEIDRLHGRLLDLEDRLADAETTRR